MNIVTKLEHNSQEIELVQIKEHNFWVFNSEKGIFGLDISPFYFEGFSHLGICAKELIHPVWEHYGGDVYFIFGLAIDEASGIIHVLYYSINNCQMIWARPFDDFFTKVPHTEMSRFAPFYFH